MAEQLEALQGYVNDMLAVEREIHQAFSRQKHDEGLKEFATAHQLIARIEDTIDRHLVELQRCLERLGTSESALKKAVGSVMGAMAGLYDQVRDDKVSRIVRDDNTALTFAVVCYEMLHTTALAMKDQQTAELALKLLKDYTPLIMGLSDVLPSVIVRELSEEGTIAADESVAREAVRHTREAWSQSAATA